MQSAAPTKNYTTCKCISQLNTKNVTAWKLNNCIHWNTGFDIMTCAGVRSCNHTLCNFQAYWLPMCWIVSWKWCEIISIAQLWGKTKWSYLSDSLSWSMHPLLSFHCVCVCHNTASYTGMYIHLSGVES